MTYRNWFIVGARLIGVWVLFQSVQAGALLLTALFLNSDQSGPLPYRVPAVVPPLQPFTLGCFELFLALFLLFGARSLADMLFRKELAEERLREEQTLLDEAEDDFYEDEDESDAAEDEGRQSLQE